MFFRKKKAVFDLQGFGVLELSSGKSGNEWFGNVQGISKNRTVELSIEVEGDSPPSDDKIEFVKRFSKNVEDTEQTVYDHAYECFAGTEWQMTKENLKKMYSLSAVVLKSSSEDIWITLEPHFDVPTIFNRYLRFTLRNNKVVWSNLK